MTVNEFKEDLEAVGGDYDRFIKRFKEASNLASLAEMIKAMGDSHSVLMAAFCWGGEDECPEEYDYWAEKFYDLGGE